MTQQTIAGFAPAELLALEGLHDASECAVYCSGSCIDGMGNPWSDIDVFVIGDREPIGPYAKQASTNATSQHYVRNRRIDFEFWRPREVSALADRLRALDVGSGRTIATTAFLWIEECFIHRLRIGVPLLDYDRFARYRALFDFDKFLAYKVEDTIRMLDAALEDLCGMMEVNDVDVALTTAREVVNGAIDAYCHKFGSSDPTRKWRVKHLARSTQAPCHCEISDEFWRLQFPEAAVLRNDRDAWHTHLEACIRFANRVTALVQG
jgi:hypothetical protein